MGTAAQLSTIAYWLQRITKNSEKCKQYYEDTETLIRHIVLITKFLPPITTDVHNVIAPF